MTKLFFRDGRDPVEMTYDCDAEDGDVLFYKNIEVYLREGLVIESMDMGDEEYPKLVNITSQCSHIQFENGVYKWNEFIDDFIETKKTNVIAWARRRFPQPYQGASDEK